MTITKTKAICAVTCGMVLTDTLRYWDSNPPAAFWSGVCVVFIVAVALMVDSSDALIQQLRDDCELMGRMTMQITNLKISLLELRKEVGNDEHGTGRQESDPAPRVGQ